MKAVQESNFDALSKMQTHGTNFSEFKDKEDKDNTLLHVAAKMENKDLIDFLKQKDVLDFDL